MPQSLANILVHLVFSTRERRPWVTPAVQSQMWPYLAQTLNNMGCRALKVGGMDDHVHALFDLSRQTSLSDVVRDLKMQSSKWMKQHEPAFCWQRGYGAFSVSRSRRDNLLASINDQPNRHAKRSFMDEFRELLERHGIDYDERYVWD